MDEVCIYPNHANDRIVLKCDEYISSIMIMEVTGCIVLSDEQTSGLRVVDIQSLSNGIYTAIVNRNLASKFVVKR